jgi:hypothetical protein
MTYYYKIISISSPYCPGQYGPRLGCLFSRYRKYVINSLIHGHFHIGLVIIPRPILALDSVLVQYGGLGMITRPIWKCLCINLYVLNSSLIKILLYIILYWLLCIWTAFFNGQQSIKPCLSMRLLSQSRQTIT